MRQYTTLLQRIALAVLFAALGLLALYLGGCKQVIIEDTEFGQRLKINTFLTSSGFDSFRYDPHGILTVGKYESIPANMKFKYDPLTHTVEAVIDSNNL